jgi:hypothetical protein
MSDDIIKQDPIFDDPKVVISQILQKVFLMGLLVGKGQLQDDADASGSPISAVLSQLQQQFDQLMPGSKGAAEVNAYGNFAKNIFNNKALDIYKKEQTAKEEKVKESNQNLTLNDKRLNQQHDVIVTSLLDSLEDEMKQAAADIVKQTKIFKK